MRSGAPMHVSESFQVLAIDDGSGTFRPVRDGGQVLTRGWWVGVLHDDGTASFEQVEAPSQRQRRIAVVLPYDPLHESVCPSCGSLWTEYHPVPGMGRCHACGFLWEFLDHQRTYGEHVPQVRSDGGQDD